MTSIVLLTEPLDAETLAEFGPELVVRECDGADRAALLGAVVEADAVVVRDATIVDAEVLAAASRLRVVARAGVDLANVDVAAATRRGVMVINTPDADAVGAAELTIALMLAAARHLGAAQAALRAGEWEPARFVGVELSGKSVGIVGLGRVGVLVAQRLAAFGMRVLAHDPFVPAGRAAQLGVRLLPLADLMAQADVVTVHLARDERTVGLIGAAELSLAGPQLVLVDTVGGGVVDEAALLAALTSGAITAAGVDVDPGSPLVGLENVVATLRLGAATREARQRAELAVAQSVRRALRGELLPDAVNLAVGSVSDQVRPGIPLTEKLGRILSALADGAIDRVGVEVRGEIADHDVTVLRLAALTGLLRDVVSGRVTPVNAALVAEERGVVATLLTDDESPDHRNLITLRGTTTDGRSLSVSGTLVGIAQRERLVEVDGFDVDLELTDHLAFLGYDDLPGRVGAVGVILGEAGVNIAGMQVARDRPGGRALMAMTVDSAVPADVLARIGAAIGAGQVSAVDLG